MKHRNKAIIILSFSLILLLWMSFWGEDIFSLTYDTDIDLNSGRLRKRYYYWIVPLNKQSYESTGFSELVMQYFDSEESPIWYEDIPAVRTWSGGKIKSGGYALAACSGFYTKLEVEKVLNELSDEEIKSYLKKALDLLKAKKFDEIEQLYKDILKELNNQEIDA